MFNIELTRLAGQKINADLISALFLLVKAFVCADLSVFVIFLFADLFTIDREARMLYARHPTRLVHRFKQIFRANCELDFSAVAYAAMTPVTHDHVELHWRKPLSFVSVNIISFLE